VITISAAIYQRKTGPTYPKQQTVSANGVSYELKLIRSLALDEEPVVKLEIKDTTVKARIYYRRYLSKDEFQVAGFSI